MAFPYRVILAEDQRAELRGLVGCGVASARTLTRASFLLKADHGESGPVWSDAAIAGALDVNPSTVLRVRRQFVAEWLAATLTRKRPDRIYERALDGEQARLVALACSETPGSTDRWSPAPARRPPGAPGGRGDDLARDGAPDAQKPP